MHPVKYHLTQKLTWMSRQLRSKNDAADLLDWITAMQSIYNLLVSFSEENCAVPCERSPCKRDLLISSHQGINYQATSTIDTSRTSTDPTGMQSRRVVKGKRTMKLRESKSTLRMTVKPQWSHNLNVNRAVSGESGSPTPITPAIAEQKQDSSLCNNMIIDDTEQRDLIKHAIMHKLDEADKDRNFWFSEPQRIKKLSREVEKDFNLKKDDLLRNDLRKLLSCTMNEFFRKM